MKTIKKSVLKELEKSRTIIKSGTELTPRFEIFKGDESFMIFVPLPKDQIQNTKMQSYIKAIMLWKSADAFIMSAEILEPDGVISVYISPEVTKGVLQPIERNPLAFGSVQWFGNDQVDPSLIEILPRMDEKLTDEQFQEAEKLFGEGGKFQVQTS